MVWWNPLSDRPRLAQALKWLNGNGLCINRIIEVRPEIGPSKVSLFSLPNKN
jgi:hypothetical protein